MTASVECCQLWRQVMPIVRLFDYALLGLHLSVALVPLALFAGCQGNSDARPPSAVVDLTDATFHQEVLQSRQPVLVEFWAPWCQPCLEMQPAIEQLARDFRGKAKVARINIDDSAETAAAFDVHSPPVVIVFRDGEILKRRSGMQSKRALWELLSSSLN